MNPTSTSSLHNKWEVADKECFYENQTQAKSTDLGMDVSSDNAQAVKT